MFVFLLHLFRIFGTISELIFRNAHSSCGRSSSFGNCDRSSCIVIVKHYRRNGLVEASGVRLNPHRRCSMMIANLRSPYVVVVN